MKSLQDVSIFQKDEKTKMLIRLYYMSMISFALMADIVVTAIHAQKFGDVSDTGRWLIQNRPIDNDFYRFYALAMSGSTEAIEVFASGPVQKFFMRHLKTVVATASEAQADSLKFPILLSICGHTLFCSRV